MIKKYKKNAQAFIILLAVWIVLNESVTGVTLALGALLAVFSLRCTNKLLNMDYAKEFYMSPLVFMNYLFMVLKEIYCSAYVMMKRIIKKDMTPTFVEFESELTNPLLLIFLANSVTLPPGSVTVERHDNKLLILTANPDKEEVKRFCKKIEQKLMRFERGR